LFLAEKQTVAIGWLWEICVCEKRVEL